MSINTITFTLYSLVIIIITWRLWRTIMALIDFWYDKNASMWHRIRTDQYRLKKKATSLTTDIIFSIMFAMIFTTIVPGIAAGAIGAFAGILVSMMINGTQRYASKIKQK